jgi:hypothetical protein
MQRPAADLLLLFGFINYVLLAFHSSPSFYLCIRLNRAIMPHTSYIFFTLRGGKRLQQARDFEENVSDFATHFLRSSGRGYGDAGEVVWWWLRDDCGVSWVALSVECACVDEMTNVVSVISHVPILLRGGECGHMKRWVMLPGQSRPSRTGDHQGNKKGNGCSTTYIPVQSVQLEPP